MSNEIKCNYHSARLQTLLSLLCLASILLGCRNSQDRSVFSPYSPNVLILQSPDTEIPSTPTSETQKNRSGAYFPGFGAAQAPGATGAWQLKLADKGPPTSNVNTPRPIAEGVKMGQDSSPTLRCPVFGYKNGKATRKKMKSAFSEDTNGILKKRTTESTEVFIPAETRGNLRKTD